MGLFPFISPFPFSKPHLPTIYNRGLVYEIRYQPEIAIKDVMISLSLPSPASSLILKSNHPSPQRITSNLPRKTLNFETLKDTLISQANVGHIKEAISILDFMSKNSFTPDLTVYSVLLKSCIRARNFDLGRVVHSRLVESKLECDSIALNSLISLYAKCGEWERAEEIFESMEGDKRDLVSWSAMISCYVRSGLNLQAIMTFFEMVKFGDQIDGSRIGLDAFTFASLLSGAASVGAVGKGERIHAQLLKSGFESDQCVANALISMYTRCGNIEAAFQVFEQMEDWNVISWTSIITGFAKHGFAKRSLELFKQMLDFGTKPNEVTYIAVLSACSHAGLIDEGWRYFHLMYKEHRIHPRMEHYACMVDLLGRSGLLEKAIQFIKSMPFMANALVWRTLLSACRVHGNAELGKDAAEMILEQEPNDPAAYILLSNLYASSGQWGKVAKIRKCMKERNLVKEAGCSWMEAENKVHKFYVGDTKHPRTRDIYEELDRLLLEIKEMGYVPNNDFVLHEVEEEQKEQYLFQHSEKIALAFGLISTSKPSPIRIFKNLRVCGDCHAAMKYISIATGREIVVRDSNRFHHIKNGSCSCNDYW
ncbi:pentatricopeptide repeat-containing At3g49170, chloroplastic [Olea europaea subsp. europaea]|uniref:Pentatricopeptide repeat-containing At3g49170, chloroplastic n=1 Tax=Olea europaea subsp. europaea TaxID=158383 RepID=A0A8S0S924_OLEEU|nr:pentatricopeptide repeat-containing At3g49170, chloroplastic [Olea europaea subsp. europaea]